MCIERGDYLKYLFYLNNGRGGAAENPYEDDSEEEICVENACSCNICFNYYTEIMFKHRKTDAERLIEQLLAFSTQVAIEETRSAQITPDNKPEKDLQPESDCESLINHFVNLRISTPKHKMCSRSEIETDELHQLNAQEPSVGLTAYSAENPEAYSEYVPHSVSYREFIRSHLIQYDFGELDDYLPNYETELRVMALEEEVRASIQSIDNEKPLYNSNFDMELGKIVDWYSWEGFEWNQSFDHIATTPQIECTGTDLSKNFNESFFEANEFGKNNEHCKCANHYDSDYSNASQNLRLRKKLSFERECDKLQSAFRNTTLDDSPLSESSVWSGSLNFDEESDEQYQADISSSFNDCENADLISENSQNNPQHQMKTSTKMPRDILLSNGFDRQEKYKNKFDVIQRRRIAVDSREVSNTSTYSDSHSSDKVALRHRQKKQWRDKVHFEEVRVPYKVESSLSHRQIWTICYDSDSYAMPRKWKRSLRQAQRGSREQIRQYFEELKSKFGSEMNQSTSICNNWQTEYDFLDYDCTRLYDDQNHTDLSTSSDETLTCLSDCSDVDEHANNRKPENIVNRRTQVPYAKARPTSKAKRVTQLSEYSQLKQFDSDESFEFSSGSGPIWCA